MTTIAQRDVTWGERLVLLGFHTAGGLNQAVERIRALVGTHIGTRNTFAKLYNVERAQDVPETYLFRAWLLLAALGEDPQAWGIANDAVPDGYDVVRLRTQLPRLDSNQQPAGYAYPQVSDLAEAC